MIRNSKLSKNLIKRKKDFFSNIDFGKINGYIKITYQKRLTTIDLRKIKFYKYIYIK